jgi:hypothetical protein
MGLDVYLNRYYDKTKADSIEAEYERRSDEVWKNIPGRGDKEYEELTEEEKDKACAETRKIKEELGLGEWGELPSTLKEKVRLDSKKYPEHMFKIGHLRSSYNQGGINHVVAQLTKGKDLYWIFEPPDQKYTFQPDWPNALKRAIMLVEEYGSMIRDHGGLSVSTISHNMFSKKFEEINDIKAMEIYISEKERESSFSDGYSNINGHFYHKKPLRVVGAIPGVDALNHPCVYLIIKSKSDEHSNWYLQALEIVVEMCEWVLSQEDKERYYLDWSS